MYKFGELADEQMADKILQDLNGKNIASTKKMEQGFFGLYVEKEKDLETAFDTFRVRLGFAPHFEMSEEMKQIASIPWGMATKLIMIFSLIISVSMLITKSTESFVLLYFSNSLTEFMPEITQGQWWRLWTPMFLHFGFLHIIFNLLCFKDFGSLVEHQHGLKNFLLWVLVLGLFSNLGQYLVQGPRFGGLSGVLFGLLGIVWTYKIFHAESVYALPKSSVVMLLVWFFICLVGLLPGIANTAHAVGLSLGMAIGIIQGLKNSKTPVNGRDLFMYSSTSLIILLATLVIEYYRMDSSYFYQNL